MPKSRSNSNPKPIPEQCTAIDTTLVEWDKNFNPKPGVELGRLMLRKDSKNGAEIRMIRYPKGIVNPEHEHLAPVAPGVHSHPGARARSARHARALGTGSSSWKANFGPNSAQTGTERGYGSRGAK